MFSKKTISDRGLAEIDYHKRLNRRLVYLACPVFIAFLVFYYYRSNYFQVAVFLAMLVNAITAVAVGFRVKSLHSLVLSKQIGSTIAFALLAVSIVSGLLDADVYVVYPWIFSYPICVMLFFGAGTGFALCTVFYVITVIVLLTIDYPAWSASSLLMFKLSSVFALTAMVGVGIISERTRVRIRNMLIRARNKYKSAEEAQRETNAELKTEIQLRIQSERALLESESRYRILFEESTISQWEENYARVKTYLDELPLSDADDYLDYFKENPQALEKCLEKVWVTAVNQATLNLYEADSQNTLVTNIWLVLPPNALAYMADRLVSLYRTGRYNARITGQTLSGKKLHLLVDSIIPAGYERSWEKVLTAIHDFTDQVAMEQEKKRVEKQIEHTRQIQAVASLAGGIAHQFNNSLAIILGNLDLLELNVPMKGDGGRFIHALRTASNRIGKLTDQLLAYAQGGKYQPGDFMVQEMIERFLPEIEVLRDSSVKVITRFAGNVAVAGGDITQIKSVIEAVLTNAVEAMEEDGTIEIRTSVQSVGGDRVAVDASLSPGYYAVIAIKDDGDGMDDDTRRRIFEPFFSTKFLGRGLGMAAAFGIVKNHNGTILVNSRKGAGTSVSIYLPSADSVESSGVSGNACGAI